MRAALLGFGPNRVHELLQTDQLCPAPEGAPSATVGAASASARIAILRDQRGASRASGGQTRRRRGIDLTVHKGACPVNCGGFPTSGERPSDSTMGPVSPCFQPVRSPMTEPRPSR